MKLTYKHILYLNLAANLYYLPTTIYLIVVDGGPMGFGYMLVPFSFLINLLIGTSIYDLLKGERKFAALNLLGFSFAIILSLTLTYFKLSA